MQQFCCLYLLSSVLLSHVPQSLTHQTPSDKSKIADISNKRYPQLKPMFKNSADIELKHKRFLIKVLETNEVWTLKNNNGYVSSSSNHFEDEEEEPLLLQIFWSSKKEASVASRYAWPDENFQVESIPLKSFIEFWCAGMYHDNIIVGTNFDHNLFGYEEAPLVLAKDLLNIVKKNGIKMDLENYESIDEYLEIIETNI
jgi:hypothetical protein